MGGPFGLLDVDLAIDLGERLQQFGEGQVGLVPDDELGVLAAEDGHAGAEEVRDPVMRCQAGLGGSHVSSELWDFEVFALLSNLDSYFQHYQFFSFLAIFL